MGDKCRFSRTAYDKLTIAMRQGLEAAPGAPCAGSSPGDDSFDYWQMLSGPALAIESSAGDWRRQPLAA